jgi:DNA-binding CsgD family transcriptional regulator
VDESWTTLLHAESIAEDRGEHLAVVAARGLRALQAAVGRRPEEAAQLAASAEDAALRHGLVELFNTATVRTAQGWVALHDRPRRALEHFRRALELVRRGGLSVEVAELLTASGMAEERLGWHTTARRHRNEACQILARCPDPGYLWADPRDTGDAPTVAPRRNGVELSPRQAEILRLLADALTNAEIGERLRVSPRTVEAHLRTLYRKLGVRSRTAPARYAVEHRLAGE